MEIFPFFLLIGKLSVGSSLLEIKQLQIPEVGFASTKMGATYFARGLTQHVLKGRGDGWISEEQ